MSKNPHGYNVYSDRMLSRIRMVYRPTHDRIVLRLLTRDWDISVNMTLSKSLVRKLAGMTPSEFESDADRAGSLLDERQSLDNLVSRLVWGPTRQLLVSSWENASVQCSGRGHRYIEQGCSARF